MNTNPDEARLALWLDDELADDEAASFDAWASSQPEHVAAREELRRYRAALGKVLPASEEPPYPDFFNSRILRAASESTSAPAATPAAKWSFWRSWWVPATAFAGMTLAFWMGRQSQVPETANAPSATAEVAPALYTPDRTVNAEWFASAPADATVIVLQGVSAIPDTTDFNDTALLPQGREIDSTAGSKANGLLETP